MANRLKIDGTSFSVGDTIQVHQKIQEGEKVRIQVFEGVVISIKGRQENKMFTVRKIASGGVGVERIWPALSPWIKKVEVKRKGQVRRAKLYYLRKRVGKKAIKIKTKKEKKEAEVKVDQKKKPRRPRRKPGPKKAQK
jgi:large subunit ribosomal protein L19